MNAPEITSPATVPTSVDKAGSEWQALVENILRQVGALGSFIGALVLALVVFGIVLLLFGKDPLRAYVDIFNTTLGNFYFFSEVLVKFIPLVFCALAVLLPARIGLVNVGGEGQLYLGAWLATWGALTFGVWPRPVALPLVILCGFIGGALWAALPALLRIIAGLNETISTLLLNYVAVLFVNFFIFGAWKDPDSANFPQTKLFADAVLLPKYLGTRVHFGLVLALLAAVLLYFVLKKTRWGFEMRAIGGNTEAARRKGLPIARYILINMMIGGGLAGLAGMGEVLAIQGRLLPGISPGYGYMGFLISWLAVQNPLGVVVMAFVMAVIALGGDMLQTTQAMPYATVNILMALILFIVLGGFFKRRSSG